MRQRTVSFSPPFVGEDEAQAVAETVKSGWLTTGPKVQEFESELMKTIRAPAAHAVSSCTAALRLALTSCDVGPGDAVATTSLTFCSTVNVIEEMGAYPILLDVNPDTLNLDPEALELFLEFTDCGTIPREHPYFLSQETGPLPSQPLSLKAILPVHFGGLPVDIRRLDDIALRYSLFVIEDAAHALPACTPEGPIGTVRSTGFPHATCFSFYATKNLAMGEGGLLAGHPELVQRARGLSLHGMTAEAWRRYTEPGLWQYDVPERGFKYNLTDPQAAIGLVQLQKLTSMWQRRRDFALDYGRRLNALLPQKLVPAQEHNSLCHANHLYVTRLSPELASHRSELIRSLSLRGIATSVHFRPVHTLSYYADRLTINPTWLTNTDQLAPTLLSLPLHPGLSEEDVEYVITNLVDLL